MPTTAKNQIPTMKTILLSIATALALNLSVRAADVTEELLERPVRARRHGSGRVARGWFRVGRLALG